LLQVDAVADWIQGPNAYQKVNRIEGR